MKPQVIDALTAAFPANVIGTLLPIEKDIPKAFRDGWSSHGGWPGIVTQWFYEGIDPGVFVAKEGIDKHAALRHLRACIGSFEPSHEHKCAGVAYLMSEWFEPVTIERAAQNKAST